MSGTGGVPLRGGNAKWVQAHGGRQCSKLHVEADLLPHGQSDEMREAINEERRVNEELAAAWRAAAADASTLAATLLLDPSGGSESVAAWLNRRFTELGIKLPCITVAYQGVTVETDAAVGAAGIPSVSRWLGLHALLSGQLLRSSGGAGTTTLPVLREVNGVLHPGRLTLLLGPPGAGKSVLLQTLAGQLQPSKTLRISGRITYNGLIGAEFDLQRTASYVDQYDVHLPLLTVRETLAFAYDALWASGSKNDLHAEFAQVLAAEEAEVGPQVLPRELQREVLRLMGSKDLMVEFTLRLLGLDGCADTVVGDTMIRGISGGQKRRLTCGELLVGGRELLLLDEISTGLDSATTFTVVRYLGILSRTMRANTVISLLQPSGNVMALFDDVMLLAEGRMLYHGPVDAVVPFFTALGFACPSRKEVPAFVQQVTSAVGQRQLAQPRLLARSQNQAGLLVLLADIEAAFWKAESGPGANMQQLVANAPGPEGYADVPKTLVHEADVSPWWTFFCLCARRQFMLLGRDAELLQGRLFQVVLAGAVVGTLFLQIDVSLDNAMKFLGVSFTSVAMLAFISLPLTGTAFAQKHTFLKQRALRFFPPSSYGAAFIAQEMPITLLCALLFSIMVYFIAGYTYSAGGFFMYTALLLLSGLVFGALFILLAALTPTLQVAGGLCAVILLMLILLSGFSIVRQNVPGWWIWGFWCNPMAWAFRGIATNEFLRPRWNFPVMKDGSIMRAGDVILSSVGMYSEYKWVWGGLGFLAGCYLLLLGLVCAGFALTPNPTKVATVAEAELKGSSTAEAAETGDAAPSRSIGSQMKLDGADAADGHGTDEKQAQTAGVSAMLNIPFTPMTLVFKEISYYVRKPAWSKAPESKAHPGMIQLLHSLSGMVSPGQLTCLMGASGAGKTTLLDVISGRKTQGVIEGEIRLNGHPKQDPVWRRVSAYVEQQDIHTETATVREALLFSARLRLPSHVHSAEIASYVDGVLELVELHGLRNSLVGVGVGGGSNIGLSLEQRKRLSIAVELVASPAIIFMDEPTSGLDGHSADVVMRVTRSVANLQRTVCCTIHQPSAEIFYNFDALVLLQTGGHMMYCGPLGHESRDLIAYFSSAGVRPIQPGENPANWMLDVAGGSAAGGGANQGPDFVQLYRDSELLAGNMKAIAAACDPVGEPPSVPGGTYAATYWQQLRALLGRQAVRYWRLPQYNGIRLVVSVAFALVVGSLYYNQGQIPATGGSTTNITNVMGMLFMGLSNLGGINVQSVLIVAAAERAVLYRERAAGMYSALMYVNAAALVELPYLVAQVCLFVPITYFMVGFKLAAGPFFFFLMVFWLSLLTFTFFGQMCLYVAPNVQAAQAIAATLAGFFDMLNGFYIPKQLIPVWWRWFWYCNPVAWMAYAVAANQLAGDTTEVTDAADNTTTVQAFLESTYGYYADMAWWSVLILMCFILLFRTIATLAVRFLTFQSR